MSTLLPKKIAEGQFPRFLRGHDVLELVKMVGLTLKASEEELLRKVARMVVWRGRDVMTRSSHSMDPLPLSATASFSAEMIGVQPITIDDPKILFERWFERPIAQLAKLEEGDGGQRE